MTEPSLTEQLTQVRRDEKIRASLSILVVASICYVIIGFWSWTSWVIIPPAVGIEIYNVWHEKKERGSGTP